MPGPPSDPAFALLLLAALVVAYNMSSSLISLRNAFRGAGRLYPTLYLASAILTACALLVDPRPEARWMIVVPLADFSNFAVPCIALDWIWRTLKRGWTHRLPLLRSLRTIHGNRRAPAPARRQSGGLVPGARR